MRYRGLLPGVILGVLVLASGSGASAAICGEWAFSLSMFGICALVIWVGWFR